MPVSSSSLTRHGIHFALLLALFLTAMVVFQQQCTIESQRLLIRELFQDSMQLNGMRMAALNTRSSGEAQSGHRR